MGISEARVECAAGVAGSRSGTSGRPSIMQAGQRLLDRCSALLAHGAQQRQFWPLGSCKGITGCRLQAHNSAAFKKTPAVMPSRLP